MNDHFRIAPTKPADLHGPTPKAAQLDLILSFRDTRVVRNDHTISWEKRCLQLRSTPGVRPLAGKTIEVVKQLDGTLRLRHQGRDLLFDPIELSAKGPARPSEPAPADDGPKIKGLNRTGRTPAASHPWRKDGVGAAARAKKPATDGGSP